MLVFLKIKTSLQDCYAGETGTYLGSFGHLWTLLRAVSLQGGCWSHFEHCEIKLIFTTHWKRKRIHFLQLQGKSDTCTMTRNLTNAVEVDYVCNTFTLTDQYPNLNIYKGIPGNMPLSVSLFTQKVRRPYLGPNVHWESRRFQVAVVSPLQRVRQRVILKAISAQSWGKFS